MWFSGEMGPGSVARLFVYGTLMPGQGRWPLLAPLVTSAEPEPASAAGRLYRTPYGWPAAVLDYTLDPPMLDGTAQDDTGLRRTVLDRTGPAAGVVPGVVVTLREPRRALPVLDEIEGTGTGLFERRLVATSAGRCWAYHWPRPTAGFEPVASWVA
jgi:gamma-glutamylcyclotransferase (GGCT)/AIG2-like uncharacterized protein YtfP